MAACSAIALIAPGAVAFSNSFSSLLKSQHGKYPAFPQLRRSAFLILSLIRASASRGPLVWSIMGFQWDILYLAVWFLVTDTDCIGMTKPDCDADPIADCDADPYSSIAPV
jgi:hypothetical protein